VLICGVLISGSVFARPTLTCDISDPAISFVKINGLGDAPVKVDVVEVEGQKVFEYDMSELEPGSYTVFLTPGNDWEDGAPTAPLSFVRPPRLSQQSIQNLRLNFTK